MEERDHVTGKSETPSARQRRAFPSRRGLIVLACAVCVAILLLRLFGHREPPDLTACTRIEVHYTYGALEHFFGYSPMTERMLSEEERQYVCSFDKWTVTNPEQIRAFSELIRQGADLGIVLGKILDVPIDITCYRGTTRAASFRIYRTSPTVIANWHTFSYQPGTPLLRSLDPPVLKPLKMRFECARNTYLIYSGLWPSLRVPRPDIDPNHWCDVFVERSHRSPITYAPWFICPSVHTIDDENDPYLARRQSDRLQHISKTWISDYAMNSNCRADSPDDTVFLFESQPGWNQHGGPELFTFDNHDPKGGCVLFNDGSVKFIRTAEELAQLRWQP